MSWLDERHPQVILAPMDGYTDPPFRRFAKRVEPRIVVFSEFLPATQVARKPSLAASLFQIFADEQPVVIQLYGKDAADFATAARLAEAQGAAGIDINMGCPAKKVVAHRHGSALMKEIDLACAIIAEVKRAVTVPVTVKTRLGWENHDNLIPFVLRLQDHGLDGITIHGRTYQQKFDGQAVYAPIHELKRHLRIPVFGNGDIDGPDKAKASLGNLDGLMVGRAAVANPWILTPICDAVEGNEPSATIGSFQEKLALWKIFAEMAMASRDERSASHAFRKYLLKVVRELDLNAELRQLAISVESLDQIHTALDRFAEAARA